MRLEPPANPERFMPQRLSLLDRIKAMPAWPADGSVQRIDGVFIVKFSDYSQGQRIRYELAD